MTDEGWQLFDGLEMGAGYTLAGYELDTYGGHGGSHTLSNLTDVPKILEHTNPSVVVVQDKREYEGKTAGGERGFNTREKFTNVRALQDRRDIFKLTIVKDAQHDPEYHRESAIEIGAHAWLTYYHPSIVSFLAPYIREEHLIRIYHTVDKDKVPIYTPENRKSAILSGAINSTVYPLRSELLKRIKDLPNTDYLNHPGYHRNGCRTTDYLRVLSHYKVAIATSSIYGYALRKLVESTACGCIVITDLPEEDTLPFIDDNLIRVNPNWSARHIGNIIREAIEKYDPDRQAHFAREAINFYDFRVIGLYTAAKIEALRKTYPNREPE
jgi:hypothetical protein